VLENMPKKNGDVCVNVSRKYPYDDKYMDVDNRLRKKSAEYPLYDK
jgi:hypothetical protein